MSFPEQQLSAFRGVCKDFEVGTLLPGQSPDMQNIRLTIRKEIEKIDGYAKFNANQNPEGAVEIKGGFDYQKWDTITRRLVVGTKTKLYAFSQKKNELTANQSDVETNTTGFAAIGAGTITRDTNNYYQGVASLKIVTGAVSGDGGEVSATAVASTETYTASVYVKGTAGDVLKVLIRNTTAATSASTTKTMNGKWQRVQVSLACAATNNVEIELTNNAAVSITVYADAFMLEANTYAGHWTRGGDNGWTSLLTSTTPLDNEFWDFEYCDDLLVACNGIDKPYFWDGQRTSAQDLGGNVWENYQQLPFPIFGNCMCTLFDIGFTMAGNNLAGGYPADSVRSFSYFGNSWSARSSITTGRYGASEVSYVDDGLVSIVGGEKGAGAITTHEEYGVVRNKWSTLTVLPTAASKSSGFRLGIKGYVCGGYGAPSSLNKEFDRILGTWSAKANLNNAKEAGMTFVLDNGLSVEGYVMGSGAVTTDNESYNQDDNAWTTRQSLLIGGNSAQSSKRYDSSFSHGFYFSTSGNPTDCYLYHELGNSWVSKLNVPSAIYSLNAGCTLNGIVHGAGGSTESQISQRWIPDNGYSPAQFLMFWQGVLFTAGDPDNPSRVLYSDLHKIRTQRYNAFMDMPLDRITGMFKFQNAGYVLSRDGGIRIHGTTFDPDITIGNQFIEEVPTLPGCVSHRSIILVPSLGAAFWWSENGPVMWDGSQAIKLASRYMSGEPRGLSKYFNDTTAFAVDQHKYIIGYHRGNKSEVAWCLTSTGTSKNRWFIYNYSIDELVGPITYGMASVFDIEDMFSDLPVYLGGDYSGYIHQLGTGNNFDGGAIDAYYRTDFLTFGTFLKLKDADSLYTLAKRSGAWNLTIKNYLDWSATANKTDTETLNPTTVNKVMDSPMGGDPFNAIQLEWGNNQADQPFTVIGASIGIDVAPQETPL